MDLERRFLSALLIEILILQPRLEPLPDWRPFLVDDREPGSVAVTAFDDEMLAEDALKGESEAQSGTARGLIKGIAFPFEAAHAQFIEGMAHHLEDGIGCLARSLQAGSHPDMADLDDAIGRIEAHEGAHAGCLARGFRDEGVKPWILRSLPLGEPRHERL